ncbi:unnamed protein product, partial [Phaeothamnion confervicola]
FDGVGTTPSSEDPSPAADANGADGGCTDRERAVDSGGGTVNEAGRAASTDGGGGGGGSDGVTNGGGDNDAGSHGGATSDRFSAGSFESLVLGPFSQDQDLDQPAPLGSAAGPGGGNHHHHGHRAGGPGSSGGTGAATVAPCPRGLEFDVPLVRFGLPQGRLRGTAIFVMPGQRPLMAAATTAAIAAQQHQQQRPQKRATLSVWGTHGGSAGTGDLTIDTRNGASCTVM